VWTGGEMIVWGGGGDSGILNTGGRYSPTTNSWTATSTTNAPMGRGDHSVVWTGTEMIVWGGYFFDGNYHFLNSGGRYNPNIDNWTATATINAPDSRTAHTAVWTGNEMIVWGGYFNDGLERYLNTGGRYDPSGNSWTATSTTNAPARRAFHTAVWTGVEMIVWGGGVLNSGGRYCAQSGPTPTPTPTPTPCTGRCTPTPRPRPTPAPRP
jgi:N-acetylneuraminic acid mutarotase